MAIDIKVEPKEFQSVYNDVIIVLDSDKKTEPNFQYVIDVNINGTYSTRLKVQSNPQGFGVVNIAKHLQAGISSDIPSYENDTPIFNKIPNSFDLYSVKLYEEYIVEDYYYTVTNLGGQANFIFTNPHSFNVGDSVNITGSMPVYNGYQTVLTKTATSIQTTRTFVSHNSGNAKLSGDVSTITEDTTAVFSAAKFGINNVLDFEDVQAWDSSDYTLQSGTYGKFLTNLPTTYYSRLDDNITMNVRANVTSVANYLRVVTNLGTYDFENQHNVNASDTEFLSVRVGAGDFSEDNLDGDNADSFPMFNDSTVSYTVYTIDDRGARTSEIRTFIIDRSCTNHENIKLSYLNRGGSFSPYNFGGASIKSIDVRKKSYEKNIGAYDVASNTYGYTSHDVGNTSLSTSVKNKLKLNTNFLPESIGNLIKDLIISPKVYKIDTQRVARSIDIKTSSMKIKKSSINKLISYSIDVEFSSNDVTQK